MTTLAIDPGINGGLAYLNSRGQVEVMAMPERKELIEVFKKLPADAIVYIEAIAGYIPYAGPGMMFTFGEQVERVSAILWTLKATVLPGITIEYVQPKKWQADLGLEKPKRIKAEKGADKKILKQQNSKRQAAWKNSLMERAKQKFPQFFTGTKQDALKKADALLILEWAVTENFKNKLKVYTEFHEKGLKS